MQLQNNLHNLSEESKKDNSELDINSQNPFIFQNSSNKIDTNIKKEEKENIFKSTEFEKSKKDILNKANNMNINDNLKDNSHQNFLNFKDNINYLPKIDKSIDNNMNNICSNNQNTENNSTIYNTNDENFFNYSFYNNNKNNNINNNKLNESDDLNNISNNEEPIQNNKQSQQKSFIEQPNLNLQNVEPNSNNNNFINNRSSLFSFENSNNNFKKKTKHKKHFKIRFGDWICPKCENLNFSFRYKCNRCGLSKEKIENYNNNQNNENNLNRQRPIIFNNININYIFNSNFPLNNINLVYNPILFNTNNINNYYGNYNNYQIYYPYNVNIK